MTSIWQSATSAADTTGDERTTDGSRALRADAMLLDVCGVLFDDTFWSRWLFQLVSRMGLHTSYGAFVHAWEQQYEREVNLGRREFWSAVRDFLSGLGLRRGQIEEACVAGQARRRQFDESIRPLPGVKLGLAQLSARHWPLGAICNGPAGATAVRNKLSRMGLEPYFSVVLASCDINDNDTARYQAAAERFGTAPASVLLVSSSSQELTEAARAGLTVIGWQMRVPPSQVPVVQDFAELSRFVQPARVPSLAG